MEWHRGGQTRRRNGVARPSLREARAPWRESPEVDAIRGRVTGTRSVRTSAPRLPARISAASAFLVRAVTIIVTV